MNLHRGDDWDKMCNTSPATIYGVHYDRPTVCENKVGHSCIQSESDALIQPPATYRGAGRAYSITPTRGAGKAHL